MTKFVIGDEEYTEEVNTSYDQDQEIGDDPQALNTELSNSEPIDAPTGGDFYTIQTGGPKEGLGEFQSVWKQLGYESYGMPADLMTDDELTDAQLKLKGGFQNISYLNQIESEIRERSLEKFESRKQQQWYHATDQTYLDDEPHENRKVKGEVDHEKHFDLHEYDQILEDGFSYQEQEGSGGYYTCKKCGEVIHYDGWSSDVEDLLDEHLENHGISNETCYICDGAYPSDDHTSEQHEYELQEMPDDMVERFYKNRDEQRKKKSNEKLNKDGTGTAVARRGINPNNKKHVVMKFDYVSQSDCKICRPYDGHVWGRDSPNRPVIPRLESQGKKGSRPYTHPNCKCRWIKVFNEVNTKDNMIGEAVDPKLIARARKEYGNNKEWDALTKVERNLLIIEMLKKDLGWESESKEFIELVDPLPLASMAQIAFNAIKEPIKTRLKRGEVKVKATEQEGPYGIQPMLDQIVNKALGKEEKEEIEEEVNKDFTLDNLLQLVADKLAKKAAKKMGLESHKVKGNEVKVDEDDYMGDYGLDLLKSHDEMSCPLGFCPIHNDYRNPEHKELSVGQLSREVRASEFEAPEFICPNCENDEFIYDTNTFEYICKNCRNAFSKQPDGTLKATGDFHVKPSNFESHASEDVISDYRDTLDIDDSEEFDRLIAEQDRIIEDIKNQKPKAKIPLPDDYDNWADGSFSMESHASEADELSDEEFSKHLKHTLRLKKNQLWCKDCDQMIEGESYFGEAEDYGDLIEFGSDEPVAEKCWLCGDPTFDQEDHMYRKHGPNAGIWELEDWDGTITQKRLTPEEVDNLTGYKRHTWISESVASEFGPYSWEFPEEPKDGIEERWEALSKSERINLMKSNGWSADATEDMMEEWSTYGWIQLGNNVRDWDHIYNTLSMIEKEITGESLAREWTTYDEEDYKSLSPDVLTDDKEEAEEYKMDTLCDTCGKPYEDHDRFSTQHEFKFPEGWADESRATERDWDIEEREMDKRKFGGPRPDDDISGYGLPKGVDIPYEDDDVRKARKQMKDEQKDLHDFGGYDWQEGGESRANEFLDIEDDDYLRIRFHDKDGNTYCNYCGERFYQETNEEITRHYKGHEDGTLEYEPHSYAPPPPDLFSKKYNPLPNHRSGDFGYENKGNESRAKEDYGFYGEMKCPDCDIHFKDIYKHLTEDHIYKEDEARKIIKDAKGLESKATEGGKGSGRIDHRPWMLGAELSDVCEVCMISTEWSGTICTMCGTDRKSANEGTLNSSNYRYDQSGLDDDVFGSVIDSYSLRDEKDAVFDSYYSDIEKEKHRVRDEKDKTDREWAEKEKKDKERRQRERLKSPFSYTSHYAVDPDFGAHNRAVGSGYAGYPY